MPQAIQFFDLNLPPDSNQFGLGDWGALAILFGVLVMGTDYPLHDKQADFAIPSLWVAEPIDDSLSLLETALREGEASRWDGEHTEEVLSLLEENARLRELLVQLSSLILKNVVHAT